MTTIRPGSVTFQNVTKKFGNFTALPDLSLTVEPGTLVRCLVLRVAAKPRLFAFWRGWNIRHRAAS